MVMANTHVINQRGGHLVQKSECKQTHGRTWPIVLFCQLPRSVIFNSKQLYFRQIISSKKNWNQRHFSDWTPLTDAKKVVKIQQNKTEKLIYTRHETISDDIWTCARKTTLVSIISRTEPKPEKWEKIVELKSKNGYAQKYRQTVRGIRGVNPEKEKVGYGGKDLQKRTV